MNWFANRVFDEESDRGRRNQTKQNNPSPKNKSGFFTSGCVFNIMLSEISLLNSKNKDLRKCFLFFFTIAVFSYLSIMVSFCPFNDDICRYLMNVNVGTLSSSRLFTLLIETFTYLSNVITDVAPFSHILSCIFLSYGAIICLKIFKVNLKSRLEVACFVPVVVNPYMLEVMMFRFDNPFSTLALLFCILAAYLSTKNDKNLLFIQTVIFFLSLFIYQPALSAYFILGTYKFLHEIGSGRSFLETISKMRYWIYTVLITAVGYIPFTYQLNNNYTAEETIVALPINAENINAIIRNISMYCTNLWSDWSQNCAGNIFFVILIIFILRSLTELKITKFSFICSYIFGIFVLILCPIGAIVTLKALSSQGNETIPTRCLYSMGILISGVLYKASSLFKIFEKSYKFYGFVITCFCFWNIIFMNSSGNIVHSLKILQRHVLYDVSKDIHRMVEKNKKLSGLCCTGSLQTCAMNNFAKLYPMIYRIIPEQWHMPTMCQIAMIDYKFANISIKYLPADNVFEQVKYRRTIKSHPLYDISILDDNIIHIHFKSSRESKARD